MQSVMAQGKGLVKETSRGKRGGGEDDCVRDRDAWRDGNDDGGSGNGDRSGGRGFCESRNEIVGGYVGGVQMKPQNSGVEKSVRNPDKEHLE